MGNVQALSNEKSSTNSTVMVGEFVFSSRMHILLTMLTSVTPVDLSFLFMYVPESEIYVRKYVIECDSYESCVALALWSE